MGTTTRRVIGTTALGVVLATGVAGTADACGGLIGENGTIQLVRTTTLAAYTDGVERYVTAFEFIGEGEEVGSIIPLPGVPTEVVRGGDWTLQRLALEVAPPPPQPAGVPAASEDAEVLLEVEIDALDITVLRGGGDEVGAWAIDNGFLLTPDAPEVLDFYARRSPVFMAARFNAERAAELDQQAGDSTPIMATIPTDDPWVPLRILGLGADASEQIEADVFLLTDAEPALLAGGPGLTVSRSEPARDGLLDDLRSDVGMEWLPEELWLSYLQLSSPAGELDFDLAVSATPGRDPELADTGVPEPETVPLGTPGDGVPRWPLYAGVASGPVAAAAALRLLRRRPAAIEAVA
jgi:hypothetical protein